MGDLEPGLSEANVMLKYSQKNFTSATKSVDKKLLLSSPKPDKLITRGISPSAEQLSGGRALRTEG